MATPQTGPSVSRRSALAGLGAGGLGLALAATARPAAAQDAATEMATHPLVGLWIFNGAVDPSQGPEWMFELYHADGTYVNWNGLNAGAALGIWRPTGARTAEVLLIYIDTDPFPGGVEGPGTAMFRSTLEVDEAGATVTYSGVTLDGRDQYGTHLFPPGPFPLPSSTRVTFDRNPATGSTVVEATPTAATPTS